MQMYIDSRTIFEIALYARGEKGTHSSRGENCSVNRWKSALIPRISFFNTERFIDAFTNSSLLLQHALKKMALVLFKHFPGKDCVIIDIYFGPLSKNIFYLRRRNSRSWAFWNKILLGNLRSLQDISFGN